MQHFQSKNHMLMWLEENISRKAVVRALQEGRIEFVGGFKQIPPTDYPGWIVKIESVHGKIWNVAIIAYQNRYGIRILQKIPWSNWAGTFDADSFRHHLYSGDNPEKYKELRDDTITKK